MINLLPDEEKKFLEEEKNFKSILIISVIFLTSLFSLWLILFSLRIYTLSQADLEKNSLTLKEQQFGSTGGGDLRKRITEANSRVSKINTFYQKQIKTGEILEKISNILPEGIYLKSFSLTKDSKDKSLTNVTISGFSPTRDTLFQLKKNLENEKEFKEVSFPPSSWIDPINIDFSLSLRLGALEQKNATP